MTNLSPPDEVRQLGVFAPHWLSDAILAACRGKVHPTLLDPSSLLQSLPECAFVVVLYVEQSGDRYRSAVPIVLKWFDLSHAASASSRLPRRLQELAKSVQLACGSDAKTFTLREVRGFDQWLSTLEHWEVTGWDSAYASLAAALLATRNRHAPDPYVAATASRRDSRFAAVDGIDAKFSAFDRLGVKTVFVAEGVRASFPVNLQIEVLHSSGQVIQDLLPMLKRIIAKPQSGDTIEVRASYYDTLRRIGAGKAEETLDFYSTCLLTDLASRLRAAAVESGPLSDMFAADVDRGLVCIDTHDITLNLLLYEVVRPKVWILLHRDPKEEMALLPRLRKFGHGSEPTLISMNNLDWPQQLEHAMKAEGTSRTSWVADVTGGKSQAKLDLYRICVEQGVRTFVVDSQSKQRERSTGTEKLIAIGHPSR